MPESDSIDHTNYEVVHFPIPLDAEHPEAQNMSENQWQSVKLLLQLALSKDGAWNVSDERVDKWITQNAALFASFFERMKKTQPQKLINWSDTVRDSDGGEIDPEMIKAWNDYLAIPEDFKKAA